ncbi:MAG TPA: S8 family serine peptidase [Polyangiaceae bacterium]|nr:S8 family serine peptidase [Polyangiaceae bacterium]
MKLRHLGGIPTVLLSLFAGCVGTNETTPPSTELEDRAPSSVGPEDRAHVISLDSVVIDTRTAPAMALGAEGGDGYRLVKFGAPVTSEQRRALEQSVARVYAYLPHDTFLVRAAPGVRAAEVGAAWTGAYEPAYKVSRAAREISALAAADGDASARTVMVTVYPDADLDGVARRAAASAEVVGADAGGLFSRVRLRVPASRVGAVADELARLPDVFWVDVEGRRVLYNDTTVWVGQSGLSGGQTTPVFDRGLHGEGQVVGFIDTGIDADSCFFRDPSRGLPPRNECNGGTVTDPAQRKLIAVDFLWSNECSGGVSSSEWDTQGHGSHVGGTIAGDNFANPIGRDPGDGMAPAAKLVAQDCGFQTDNCADCPGLGCAVVDLNPLFQQAYDQGARIHTNSWGDNENATVQNNYSTGSQDVDEFAWNHKDFLIVFAAGNSGPGTGSVGSPSTAKNTVSVGATLRGTSANSMASFSSCGPTSDGRVKPDVTIPGSGIISARSDFSVTTNNCTTTSSSGTSMAAPAAAGLATLIRQYYTDGFYPTGAAQLADRFTPSAALVKATLINSATQMANAGAIPGNCQGWGRILLENSLFFPGQARKLFAADDAGFPLGGAGQQKTFTFSAQAGEPLKVTLAWTDFPSTPAANPNLNNDLDLVVTGPTGTFRGNVFSGGASVAGGSADRKNNLEQVLINAPASGTYTVTVNAFNVPSGAQPFALVVTGNVTAGGGGNQPPVANAGADEAGLVNATIGLDGSASQDPDGGPSALTFQWTQTAGPAVTLTGANTATPSFTPATAGAYAFRLRVFDGAAEATDDVAVTVTGDGGPAVVFADDFEQALGWTTNPSGADTATTGAWGRADPEPTSDGGARQLGTTVSGSFDLVTDGRAGTSAGAFDLDGGVTSARSPAIALPAGKALTLSFFYYFSHSSNSSSADFFRVKVAGATTQTVFQELGAATSDDAAWQSTSVDISPFAGQTVRIVIEAADASTASLVEAAVDDVKIEAN